MPRPILLLALACALACGTARADCELLYAPPEIRARLLAFHHATELRRAREQARHDAGRPRKPPQPVPATQDREAPARAPATPR
ncbi:hypothetical protein [Frateuria soli]|uniref:hypothetical protein n=1 Tax=Frateuria soli TaxID=1542730 RepID=UPI001E5F97E4|nr:hypothetical protein [Frateuria soli]UGB38634.1 hypothetical protein LQ771_01905 [Frateuria soli]